MNRICSWCQRVMSEDEKHTDFDGDKICDACYDEAMMEARIERRAAAIENEDG